MNTTIHVRIQDLMTHLFGLQRVPRKVLLQNAELLLILNFMISNAKRTHVLQIVETKINCQISISRSQETQFLLLILLFQPNMSMEKERNLLVDIRLKKNTTET